MYNRQSVLVFLIRFFFSSSSIWRRYGLFYWCRRFHFGSLSILFFSNFLSCDAIFIVRANFLPSIDLFSCLNFVFLLHPGHRKNGSTMQNSFLAPGGFPPSEWKIYWIQWRPIIQWTRKKKKIIFEKRVIES